jgi:hypothetical protein
MLLRHEERLLRAASCPRLGPAPDARRLRHLARAHAAWRHRCVPPSRQRFAARFWFQEHSLADSGLLSSFRGTARRSAPAPQEPTSLGTDALPDGHWRLFFPPLLPNPALETLSLAEVRPFLAAFHPLGREPRTRFHLLESPGANRAGQGSASSWERRMREEFISQFGPIRMPFMSCTCSTAR